MAKLSFENLLLFKITKSQVPTFKIYFRTCLLFTSSYLLQMGNLGPDHYTIFNLKWHKKKDSCLGIISLLNYFSKKEK